MQITKTLGYWKSSFLGNLKSYRISLQTSRLARISCHCHCWWWKALTSSLVKGREGGDSKVIARGSTGLKSKQSGPRPPSSWLNNHRGKLQPQPRQPCVVLLVLMCLSREVKYGVEQSETVYDKSSVKDKQFCGRTCATWHQRGRRV